MPRSCRPMPLRWRPRGGPSWRTDKWQVPTGVTGHCRPAATVRPIRKQAAKQPAVIGDPLDFLLSPNRHKRAVHFHPTGITRDSPRDFYREDGMRVGINGMGRIGRLALRAAMGAAERQADDPRAGNRLEVTHLNEPKGGVAATAHLVQFDSVQGRWRADIAADGETAIHINDRKLGFTSHATA
eukprot:gene18242-25665_t